MISTQINTPSNRKTYSTIKWVQKHMYFGLKIPILTQYRPVVIPPAQATNNTNNNNHSKQTDTATTNEEPNH